MRRRLPSPAGRGQLSLVRRLDRAAGELNPFLLFVAGCLGIVHLGCWLAVEVGRLTPRGAPPTEISDPAAAVNEAAVARLPRS